MNTDWNDLIQRHMAGLTTEDETRRLEAAMKADDTLADLYLKHTELEVALEVQASSAEVTQGLLTAPHEEDRRTFRWLSWRPVTAAGIVFGMFCTSMVYGYVNQQAALKREPLSVFDAGLEEAKQMLTDGLPDHPGQWGMDAACVVSAEANVRPWQGERMMRLEPIPRKKPVKNHTSRAYQVLDLRSQPLVMMKGEIEVEVSVSFCAANSEAGSRYLIRVIALGEAAETATKNFWSKVESDGVVSVSQRFDTQLGESDWHTSFMKLRLPPVSKTLVLIFGAVPPEDALLPVSVHYLDDVQVTLLTPNLP